MAVPLVPAAGHTAGAETWVHMHKTSGSGRGWIDRPDGRNGGCGTHQVVVVNATRRTVGHLADYCFAVRFMRLQQVIGDLVLVITISSFDNSCRQAGFECKVRKTVSGHDDISRCVLKMLERNRQDQRKYQ